MKAVIQPLAWGLAMASMLALASGVALDVVVDNALVRGNQDGSGVHPALATDVDQGWTIDTASLERDRIPGR